MQCANHPQLQATQLCLSCGRWFCPACMAVGQLKPICKTCLAAALGVTVHYPTANTRQQTEPAGLGKARHLSKGSKIMLRAGLGFVNLLLGFVGLGVAIEAGVGYGFLPFLVSLAAHVPLNRWLYGPRAERQTKSTRRTGRRGSKQHITIAQVEALLRISNGRVSAVRLASATGTDPKKAEAFLNQLVLDNKLQVGNDSEGLFYTRSGLLE